ncbi:hypothetical protein [Sporichthya sp.]|uniref:hypothetical protein n=1 Tax=Sporichthya sp. TaxID=65475 RepID=UPI00183F8DBD|nr:hypothetical protein [Sporichthya sp.]MBA3741801.1 hypothetical protein [Sporichthya sp.]
MTSFVEKIVAVDQALADGGIEHAFGGAIALGFHVASPRATADIDVNISVPTRKARTVVQALPAGVAWSDPDLAQISRTGQTRLFWDRTPVDLFFPQDELHTVVAGRTERVPFAGTTIPIISATDLTIFKALFNRTQDWADIENMLDHGRVDRAEARAWLVHLMGEDDPRLARLDRL